MSTSSVRETIEEQARALGPVLHAGVATSLTSAAGRVAGLEHTKYPHLLPLVMRAEMREFLGANAVPTDWRVGGDPRLMGQLLLINAQARLELRFLKERRRSYPLGVPHAGSNAARREHWTSPPLPFFMPGSGAVGEDVVRLLLLWDFAQGDGVGQFTLRIVHTLGPGVHGRAVPCDLILDVIDGGSIFSRLKFSGSPEDDDLFMVEIAEEEGRDV